MNEERENVERPGGAADLSAESSGQRDAATGSKAAKQRKKRPTKDEIVTVRMTVDDANDLDYLMEQLGARSRPEAVRTTVRVAAADLHGQPLKQSRSEQEAMPIDVSEALLVEVRDALRRNAESHTEVGFQFQKIGNNVNQIARVANAGGRVSGEALAGVQRSLENIERQLSRDAQRDGDRAAKMLRSI